MNCNDSKVPKMRLKKKQQINKSLNLCVSMT